MVGGDNGFDLPLGTLQQLREMADYSDCVVVIQRGDGVVDIDIFDPAIGLLLIHGQLGDGEKETPDKDILSTICSMARRALICSDFSSICTSGRPLIRRMRS